VTIRARLERRRGSGEVQIDLSGLSAPQRSALRALLADLVAERIRFEAALGQAPAILEARVMR
jgi:hypothetical protein